MLIVGLEFLSYEELLNALKTQFGEKDLERYARFLLYQAKLTLNSHERKHVCLLVDKYLHQIPWECLPCTKTQPMSRMPSIHFLVSHIQTNSLQINKDKAFYIVDPGCDLTHTREKFQVLFEKRKNWNGIIGVAPNENQFKKALTEYELFM
jgi:separase